MQQLSLLVLGAAWVYIDVVSLNYSEVARFVRRKCEYFGRFAIRGVNEDMFNAMNRNPPSAVSDFIAIAARF